MPPKRLTRAESRERTRERLLSAAAELFAENGVNGASVEQIAERAGFSRGAFYGNFADKQELVVELLDQRMRRELAEVRALREGVRSFEEMLDRLRAWNSERARHLEDWFALRTELTLYALRNPEVRPKLAERERLARAAHAEGVRERLAATGAAAPADPEFLGLILHALEDGLLTQRFLCPDGIGDEVVVDAAELLLRSWTALGRDQTGPT
ncbi:TetR/AcrR family transcriptional regulator [Amycolatopsis nigrescens]|uniref:TetR/AcrR family transcriptional regulator n=1 Tax=Amycolatopsis nigrescens TaxID=381445 RepID=UPI000369484F|nr:TetR/AcrR family transcriptional regulator [Amycolatopsis nigrescens]